LVASLSGVSAHGAQSIHTAHAQPVVDMFVGTLQGMDAYVAVASDGNGVMAYVCDGDGGTLSEDFSGSANDAQDGVLSLTGDHGAVLQLNVDASTLPTLLVPGAQITGSVTTLDGLSYQFTTVPAVSPGGLYHAPETPLGDGSTGEGWWVRLNTGEIKGITSPPWQECIGNVASIGDIQMEMDCAQLLGIPYGQQDPGYNSFAVDLANQCADTPGNQTLVPDYQQLLKLKRAGNPASPGDARSALSDADQQAYDTLGCVPGPPKPQVSATAAALTPNGGSIHVPSRTAPNTITPQPVSAGVVRSTVKKP
jgi:hypothetical protein